MSGVTGFWSYMHRDDYAEGGRILRIAADLANEYELLTGERIAMFVDRNHIQWGDEWRAVVDDALASITFFIPVLTPRYLQSEECRREFNSFTRRANQLGVRELIMPILYVDFPGWHNEPPADELVAVAKSYQWEDWTILRFEAPDSPRYRSAISRMATRLSRATLSAEVVDPTVVTELTSGDESPGFLDRVVRAEEAMSEWVQTLGEIQTRIIEIGDIATAAAERITAAETRGKGLAGRLEAFRQLSEALDPPAAAIQDLSNSFLAQLDDVDAGIRAILEKADDELQDGPDIELMPQLAEFFDQIRILANSSEEGLGSLEVMVESIAPIENQSRNLRPVLRKLRGGLTLLVDSRDVISSWVAKVDNFLTLHPKEAAHLVVQHRDKNTMINPKINSRRPDSGQL